ncbi:hypothetical protein [Actinopolymorpha pittospori]
MTTWFLLFLGLAVAALARVLPAPTSALVCRVIAVVVFALGAALVLAGVSG